MNASSNSWSSGKSNVCCINPIRSSGTLPSPFYILGYNSANFEVIRGPNNTYTPSLTLFDGTMTIAPSYSYCNCTLSTVGQ